MSRPKEAVRGGSQMTMTSSLLPRLSQGRRTMRSMHDLVNRLPLGFALAIIGFAYLAYVWLVTLDYLVWRRGLVFHAIIDAILLHSLTALTILSLLVAATRSPGYLTDGNFPYDRPTPSYDPDAHQRADGPFDTREEGIPILTMTGKPPPTRAIRRWCRTCLAFKPERCHHCSTCGKCVLKMDHHCIWLNNCIGQQNHKQFMLFLVYTTLLSAYVGAQSGWVVYQFFTEAGMEDEIIDFKPVLYFILVFVGIVFMLTVGSFLALHLWYLVNNKTTLESMRPSIPSIPTSAFSQPQPISPLPSQEEPERTAVWNIDSFSDRQQRRELRRVAGRINVWNLGWRENVEAVFGQPSVWWAWPLSVPELGHDVGRRFPYSTKALQRVQNEAWHLATVVDPDREDWDVDDGASEDDF